MPMGLGIGIGIGGRNYLVGGGAGVSNYTLGTLTLSPLTSTVGAGYTGTITGGTPGSTITATSSDSTVLTVTGAGASRSVSGVFSSVGTPTITLTETYAGATNTPNVTSPTMTISTATLQTLSLSPTTATAGSAYSGTISNATSGSTITASSSDSTTLTVTGTGITRTISGTFSAAGTPTITLTETLAGATNTPKVTSPTVTVSTAGYDTDAQAYFDAVVAAGGAALSTTDKDAYNAFVLGCKADVDTGGTGFSTWDQFDRFAWFGAPTTTAALRDLRNPAKAWTTAGGPSWGGDGTTPYRGYVGDGVGAYITPVDNMSVGPKFSLNSQMMGVVINHYASGTTGSVHEVSGQTNSWRLALGDTGTARTVQVGSASGVTSSSPSMPTRNGFLVGNRPDANTNQLFFNPTSATPAASNGAVTAQAPSANPLMVLKRTTTYSPDGALCSFYGGALSGTQIWNLWTRIQTLASALGCPLSY